MRTGILLLSGLLLFGFTMSAQGIGEPITTFDEVPAAMKNQICPLGSENIADNNEDFEREMVGLINEERTLKSLRDFSSN